MEKIAISRETIDLISNLSTINNSMLFKPGNRIRVMNVAETVFGDIRIPETLPVEFSIAEVKKFVGVFNLPALRNADCNLEFTDSHLVVKGGGTSVRYRYTDRSFATPPDLEFHLDNIDFSHDIDHETMDNFLRSAASLGLTLVEFIIEGEKLYMSATNPELGDESNDLRVELGDNEDEYEDNRFSVLRANLPLFAGGYRVTIDGGQLAEFRNLEEGVDLVYHVGIEQII